MHDIEKVLNTTNPKNSIKVDDFWHERLVFQLAHDDSGLQFSLFFSSSTSFLRLKLFS